MFSDVVMELSKKRFEEIIDDVKEKKGVKQDIELDTDDMKQLVVLFKEFYKKEKGVDFPQDPKVQLMEAVKAVFRSWDNPAPTSIAASTRFPTTGAPPSMYSPWCSATPATPPAPAWRSPATPPPAKRPCSASI